MVTEAPAAPVVARPAPPAGARPVELVLDRGRFDAGEWVSEPGFDPVVAPAVVQAGERANAVLAPGAYVAVIARSCGPVRVPFPVDPLTEVVSLPYPRCGEIGPAGRWSADDVAALHGVGLFLAWPVAGADGVWGTYDEVVAACAWYGRALAPSAPPDALPAWVVGGTVVPSLGALVPLTARDHAVGFACGGSLEAL